MFHNKPKTVSGYDAVMQRVLPLDEQWMQNIITTPWPTNKIPEVTGNASTTLTALISTYLFASVFRVYYDLNPGLLWVGICTSQLKAMQRAEKSIGNMLDSLGKKFHSLHQSTIDEELFDVVSGFEALKKHTINTNIQLINRLVL